MGIFKKNPEAVNETKEAPAPPEEPETQAEQSYIEDMSEGDKMPEDITQDVPVVNTPQPKTQEERQGVEAVREIPVCMSQSQINNLVIENNIILKQLISNLDN